MKKEHDTYIGILCNNEMHTLALSAQMATCLGQLFLCSMLRKKFHDFPTKAYNLEITELTTKYYANLPIIDGAVVGPAENILPQIIAEGLQSSIINLSTKKFSADIKYLPCDFENAVIDYGLLFRIEDHGGVSFLWSGDCPFANNRCFFWGRQRKGYGL